MQRDCIGVGRVEGASGRVAEEGDRDRGKEEGGEKVLDHRQSSERAWQRLLSAHRYGDCLVTVATSGTPQGFVLLLVIASCWFGFVLLDIA